MDNPIQKAKEFFADLRGSRLFQKDTKDYRESAIYRLSISPGDLLSSTPEIQELYRRLDDYISENPKCGRGTFDTAYLEEYNSGEAEYDDGTFGLNSWQNRRLVGHERDKDKNLTTSVVRLWRCPDENQTGWVFTESGSIYLWLKEVPMDYFL